VVKKFYGTGPRRFKSFFGKKIGGKLAKAISSKANMYFKVQFESPKLQHQITFETLKPCLEITYLSEKM
jgi:hypothetical protein